jgi:hypothetical protein
MESCRMWTRQPGPRGEVAAVALFFFQCGKNAFNNISQHHFCFEILFLLHFQSSFSSLQIRKKDIGNLRIKSNFLY